MGPVDVPEFAHGDVVVQREVMEGFVWAAMPVRFVDTGGDSIGLYRHRGTECWWPSHPRSEHPPFSEVTQRPDAWEHGYAGCLTIVPTGADYSVSLLWHHDWTLRCWYVDFIRPYQPTPIGYDFADHHLDLVVEPDGTAWVKDEHDLVDAVERGELTPDTAADIWDRCRLVQHLAAKRNGVFAQDWPAWRPDPSWQALHLDPGIGERLASSPTPATTFLDRRWTT